MKPPLPIVMLPLLVMMLFSCGGKSETTQTSTSNGELYASDEEVAYDYLFIDNDERNLGIVERVFMWEKAFVIRDGEVFARVATYPGYEDRTYYHMNKLPPDIQWQVAEWACKKADVEPPFIPDSLRFIIIRVPRTTPEEAEARYFVHGNKEIKGFLKELGHYVITEENKVTSPPEWVTENRRINIYRGP
jgi:hypothetical protein